VADGSADRDADGAAVHFNEEFEVEGGERGNEEAAAGGFVGAGGFGVGGGLDAAGGGVE
jgi:hypothetical protein